MSRDALLDRFRAVLLGRVRQVRGEISAAASAPGGANEGSLRAVMGELHTLKGEAKMLGLAPLSRLSHALEDRLRDTTGGDLAESCRVSLDALDAMARSLGQGVDVAAADAELGRILTRVAVPVVGDPSRAPAEVVDTLEEVPGDEAGPHGETRPSRPSAGRWTHVDATQVEALCERIAEFSATFRRVHTRAANVLADAETGKNLASDLRPVIEELERCRVYLDDFTALAWTLRLVPVAPTLEKLAEHARALAISEGKTVAVTVRAGDAELEREVLDQLWDSLLHLVQNAIDHGIERSEERGEKPIEGTLLIAAESEGPNVVLTVEDDGRGIDAEAVREAAARSGITGGFDAVHDPLRLVFEHGLSTRTTVSEVSGRGVGLDVVRRKIESLGGDVGVRSTPGLGTRFTLHVPSVITKERTVVVDLAGRFFGLPSRSVAAVVRLDEADVVDVAGGKGFVHEGETLPLRSLAAALGAKVDGGETIVLVLEIGGRRWALGVSKVVGEEDLVRRPMDSLLSSQGYFGGSAVLDGGELVLFLRPSLALVSRQGQQESRSVAPLRPRHRVLVADDSRVICDLVSEILAGEGYDVRAAHDGVEAIALFDAARPDLVLSDVEMPRMDGLTLLGEIRRRSQTIPVVMLTTRGSVEDRRRAAAAGADAYLVKSDFQSGLLVETVRRFLDGA